MAEQLPKLTGLQEHCFRLSRELVELWQHDPVTVTAEGGEFAEWTSAAEWLDLAAGVVNVEVITGRFDDTLMWCGSAMDYENERSRVLAELTHQLTVFSFVWGAFEIVTKVIDPPTIPVADRIEGANSPTARLGYFIRLMKTDATFELVLSQVRYLVDRHPGYARQSLQVRAADSLPTAAQGINIVRLIRNKFAHGAACLPTPDGWGGRGRQDNELLALCTRLVLLTMQLAISAYFADRHFSIWQGRDVDGEPAEANVHSVIRHLHLA